MPRGSVGALKGLAKLQEERLALDAKEAKLKQEVAAELGEVMVAAGAHMIDPKTLSKIVAKVVDLGEDEALKRLDHHG